MLRRLRLILTTVVFASCVLVTLTTAVAVFRRGTVTPPPVEEVAKETAAAEAKTGEAQPVPSVLSEEELRRLIVSEDLTKQSREARLELAKQVERLARARPDWRRLSRNVTPDQRRRA